MDDQIKDDTSSTANWGSSYQLYACDVCNWSYLTLAEYESGICPHCFNHELELVDEGKLGERIRPPEFVLPFVLKQEKITAIFTEFVSSLRFAPLDLAVTNLESRARLMFFPVWLVDANVSATWQAEVGYNYSVISHQDRFSENNVGWNSREVTENRIRWELRVGKLQRVYNNLHAPAMEEHTLLNKLLGKYDLKIAIQYDPQEIGNALVCLPTRLSKDAWSDAAPAIQSAASVECKHAARADHVRSFTWQPEFRNLNWTLLLLPFISTYYLDDESEHQSVLINGYSGALSGVRKASMKRAKNYVLWILGISIVFFVLSLLSLLLGLVLPPLSIVGGVGLLFSILVGCAAIIPPIIVWTINRQLKRSDQFSQDF